MSPLTSGEGQLGNYICCQLLQVWAKCKGTVKNNTKVDGIGFDFDSSGASCDVYLAIGFSIVELKHRGYRLLPANGQAPFAQSSRTGLQNLQTLLLQFGPISCGHRTSQDHQRSHIDWTLSRGYCGCVC